ncbi:MAG: hypothetical protein MI702_09185, partial [Chlorobiales bacterium]|nr:hypothetical protein [Chlorobiales bacterium]
DPYMGTWLYRYDAAGNLVWQKDGQGREIDMTYDPLNRIATKSHRATTRLVQYTYDEARAGYYNTGALTTLTAGEADGLVDSSEIAYNYDRMGRCRC